MEKSAYVIFWVGWLNLRDITIVKDNQELLNLRQEKTFFFSEMEGEVNKKKKFSEKQEQ